jgi:uncharacterized protein
MSKSVADRTLDWAVEWAPKDGLRVCYYGGEPTLAWPLIEASVPEWKARFREAGKPLSLTMTSNGTMLTPERRAWMDQEDIGLMVSLDGPPRTHNASRPAKGPGGSLVGSWERIKPLELLAWRPDLQVAWALSPADKLWGADALLELVVELGFHRVNFNLDFLSTWTAEDVARLQDFAQTAGRLIARGELISNWGGKYHLAGTGTRMVKPCGLATGMLAVTPEGDLFPSQEMAFTVYEDGRAPGTPDHYRVGNVVDGLSGEALLRVGDLKVEDMKPAPGFNCSDCVAEAACIGGCHCRYVGSGDLPEHRLDVPPGHCLSMRAMITGLMAGHWVERKLTPPGNLGPGPRAPEPKKQPPAVEDLPDVATLRF